MQVRGADVVAPHGVPVDLLDRLVIVRTGPYTLEEAVQILAIRAQVGRRVCWRACAFLRAQLCVRVCTVGQGLAAGGRGLGGWQVHVGQALWFAYGLSSRAQNGVDYMEERL
jgi:hypothetical protein